MNQAKAKAIADIDEAITNKKETINNSGASDEDIQNAITEVDTKAEEVKGKVNRTRKVETAEQAGIEGVEIINNIEVPEPPASIWTNEDFKYTLSDDGNSYTVTGFSEAGDTKLTELKGNDTLKDNPVVIPSENEGIIVNIIGSNAFEQKELIDVVIPDSIMEIENYAFYYNQLTEVVIPDSVESIGHYAFSYNQLIEVVIPDSVTNIETNAFWYNKLTNLTLSKNVKTIKNYAFRNNQLTKVVIPDSVTNIGHSAFTYNQLIEVVIPDSVTEIETNAFYRNKISNLTIGKKVEVIKKQAFRYNNLVEVTIPSNVEQIGVGAFIDNPLERVYMSKNTQIDVSFPDDTEIIDLPETTTTFRKARSIPLETNEAKEEKTFPETVEIIYID